MPEAVGSKVTNPVLIAERHRQLISAATTLFLENGFHKTSVRQIASAAGWQMGTLYLYISRKEDVLFLISKAIMNELSEGLLKIQAEGSPSQTLWTAMGYFFSAVNRMRLEISLLYRESASLLPHQLEALKESELKERSFLARLVQEGIESGEFHATIDPELLAHDIIVLAHMWAIKGWALHKKFDFQSYKRAQMNFLWIQLTGYRREFNDDEQPQAVATAVGSSRTSDRRGSRARPS